MKKLINVLEFLMFIGIAFQLTGLTFGVYYSNTICKKGLLTPSQIISRDLEDKTAYYTAIAIYPSVRMGSSIVNSVRKCEK